MRKANCVCLMCKALPSIFFFPQNYAEFVKNWKQMRDSIYHHQLWYEYMNACEKALCNLCVFKKTLKIGLKAQKTIIKGKQGHLFKTTMSATFMPAFQIYHKAKVEGCVLLANIL